MNKLQFELKWLVFFFFLLINGNILAQTDTLSFLHITDLHVIFNQKGYYPEMLENRKQKQYDQGEYRLRQFLKTMPQKENCDFVVATGDLVDFFEANAMDGNILNVQIKKFSRLIDDYRIPVFLTLGNHDIFTFEWNDSLDYKLLHNQNFANKARTQWIRNFSCFKDGTYYSKEFQVGKTTYKLIFLDDSFYQFASGDKTEVPYIDTPQRYWLNAQLQESETDIEIIMMHIPFRKAENRLSTTNPLYLLLSKHPSCKLILAGHHHKNDVTKFSSDGNNEIVQVQTGALVQNSENWRKIRFTEKNILISVPGNTGTELVIKL